MTTQQTKGTQHTPGPWIVRRDDEGLFISSNGLRYPQNPDSPKCGAVAECFTVGLSGCGSAEANARLIAAAPELLAAVKMAAQADKDQRQLSTLESTLLWAALDKAEGRV